MRNNFIFGVVLLFILTTAHAQQNLPQCIKDLMNNREYMECSKDFVTYLANVGKQQPQGGASQDPEKQGQAMMKMMCSPEGQAAMSCMMPFIQQCPAISQQAGGMDLSAFMQEGGFEAACKLFSGKCEVVKQCIDEAMAKAAKDAGAGGAGMNSMDMSNVDMSNMDMNNMNNMDMNNMDMNNMDMKNMDKGEMDKKVNPFAAFLMQSSEACGPMKAQVDCFIKYEKECGDTVRQLEGTISKAIEAGLNDSNTAIAGYDEMKKFMMDECPIMATKDESVKTCVVGSLSSSEFSTCYQTAIDAKKDDNECGLYDMQSKCLNENVGAKCGKDHAAFLQRNMNLIIKNVPAKCTVTDTSSANKNVHPATFTLLTLAVSAFFLL